MEQNKIQKQYGLWSSPISPLSVARGSSFSDLAWSDDGTLVWREQRSDRGVLVVHSPGEASPRDLNNTFSARARVGYGGGDFTVGNGFVYFVEAESGRIYRQPVSAGLPQPVTPAFGSAASPKLSPDGAWLLFVHTYEDRDLLAIVDSAGQTWPGTLVAGADFYMQPAWSPTGDRIAWIAWNHPNMPWDGTLLRIGRVESYPGSLPVLKDVVTLDGGPETSVMQPVFSPDGNSLVYISDKTGWWQLYRYDFQSGEHTQLTKGNGEYGPPAWVQGQHSVCFSPSGDKLFYIRNLEGFATLWQLDLQSQENHQIELDEDYTWLDQIVCSPSGDQVALIASGCTLPQRVVIADLNGKTRVLARSLPEDLSKEMYAPCEAIQWQGLDEGTVYGLFYPPHNPNFEGTGKPPLIINIHGGPTSQVHAEFSPRAQFFATRGYAVLEVNYRGSTGYGREYRNALRGMWGIYDVEDAVSGARSLGEAGRIDSSRVVIMGGSAGGFTVLKALEDFPGFFKAGICLYGVSNQFNLAAETHKFEAHYTDTLLGPLPEASELYRERSPIFFADQIQDPIAIFQGEIDRVVPRNQSDSIVASLERRNIPHEYHLYPGEGHGFRKTETIEDFYKAVEKFLKQNVIFS